MSKSFEWKCGQMTVRLDGVPESITLVGMDVEVSVFPRADESGDAVAPFVETVEALGGAEAFGIKSAVTSSGAVRRCETVDGLDFSVVLYLPDDRERPPLHRSALAAVLECEAGDALAEPRR